MKRTTETRMYPYNYERAKWLAKYHFNGKSFVTCGSRNGELAVTLKWDGQWPERKQKTYYFRLMFQQ